MDWYGKPTKTVPSGAGPIHDRWYSDQFWGRVGREVARDDRHVARIALLRAAAKRAREDVGHGADG